MQDFAHLFSDSVAAWLRGRGDARFLRYERHYRAERSAAKDATSFDLEKSNEVYAARCRHAGGRLALVVQSKAFRHLVVFLTMVWAGSLLIPIIGASQPVPVAIMLVASFGALRIKRWRERPRRR
ncbi:hypothetical protein [Paraburkholderia sp. SIMBA_054]|uniref:hypothetical protein n=1 Tax=Paraburkholderia sp. SIMBA_054 TaxID=3085795 RepID=UPI00397D0164